MARLRMCAVVAVLVLAAGCTPDAEPGGVDPSATAQPAPRAPAEPVAPEATTTSEPRSPACTEVTRWNTKSQAQDGYSADALFRVRVGKHDCYERVVFDLDGPDEAGFSVRYVPVVEEDGSGRAMPVPGDAALEVVIRGSIRGAEDGDGAFARSGKYLYSLRQLSEWQSLRAVRFAGFFEGQSTIAIGVATQVPFRAFTVLDHGAGQRRVVVDIAHR